MQILLTPVTSVKLSSWYVPCIRSMFVFESILRSASLRLPESGDKVILVPLPSIADRVFRLLSEDEDRVAAS